MLWLMYRDYLKHILTAPVYDVAIETPLSEAPGISRRLDNRVRLKREDMQPVFSYKLRGAYTLMASLTPEQRARGVIAASAGNHAQGVALAADRLGVEARIVMPKTTPEIKVAAVRRLGAEVILHGSSYDDAQERAHAIEVEDGLTYVPPFDHPLTIAGQGTVGLEILRQSTTPPDAIFVPVGGGGLIAGIGVLFKALDLPTRIIGVEPDEAPSLSEALRLDERVCLERVGIFADGAAVRQVGEECFRLCREVVDEVLTVSVDEICAAVKDIFEDTRSIAEPAGALALAGLKQHVARNGGKGQDLVAIFSGANVNFDRLRYIAELAELGEQREVLIATYLPERPGAFLAFCQALGPRQITEFNYRYADSERATVFAGVQTKGGLEERTALLNVLTERGYEAYDISDEQVAKLHVRHMVGGRGQGVRDEHLYRFEFPERPGALLKFLQTLGERFNISLFHYRNHGAAFGRVLMGVQMRDSEVAVFEGLLDAIDVQFVAEPASRAYEMFLS